MQCNTAAVENQTINFANISVENRKPDPFTLVDGRYVGHDGFVVPKNFDEFHERFPEYVRKWVSRHAERSTPEEDVEDWTQDLVIQMLCLPVMSKHREAGKQDIVQTFDPHKHYSASRECDGSVKFPRLHQKVDSSAIWLLGGVRVGWRVSEVQAAFVTSPEGSRRTVTGARYDSPSPTSTISP